MRPPGFVVGITLLLATATSVVGDAAGRFDAKLAPDKLPLHVLNRMAYGPRPADLEEVRRVGVEAWIRQQLNPTKIAQNPVLDEKLKALAFMNLAPWQIQDRQQSQAVRLPPQPSINDLLPADQRARYTNSTTSPEDRRAILDKLTPEARQQVLAATPPQFVDAIPDLKQEATRAREIRTEVQRRMLQEQQRKLNPPLNELLTPEQQRDIQSGTLEEKTAVIMSFEGEKRTQLFRSLNQQMPQVVQNLPPVYRREAIALSNPQQAVANELKEAKLLRALYSNRQLEEVLVDFWFNHFNVYIDKQPQQQMRMVIASYERDAIRPHVLGRFRDMLLATARHPAMLIYLDNINSRSPQENLFGAPPAAATAASSTVGLNENYGRELMELHTLGVNGGYTQQDVVNVARAFTGWTVYQQGGEYDFNPSAHDRAEKIVLGQKFPRGGGEEEGVKVIDILARHPSTARFISRKLAQRFVADDPPPALVDRMAATFTKTDGDLRAVMETLLLSKEFLSEGAWQAKVKSPLEMVVSSMRALNAEVTDTTVIAQRIADLGQPLYGKVEPTGYPNTGESWMSSAGLLGRMNFASALLANQISGVKVTADPLVANGLRRAMTEFAGVEPSPQVMAAVDKSAEGKPPTPTVLATVLVGSPDFQKR